MFKFLHIRLVVFDVFFFLLIIIVHVYEKLTHLLVAMCLMSPKIINKLGKWPPKDHIFLNWAISSIQKCYSFPFIWDGNTSPASGPMF